MWIVQYLKSMGANFGKVDDRLYRGARLNADRYKKLRKLGVRVIINLIDGDQSKAKQEAKDNGFEFVHIPMSDSETPKESDIKNVLSIINDNNSIPVYIHCHQGRHRTGLIVAIYRVLYSGWTKDGAWEEAEKFGWYSALGHQPLEDYFWYRFNKQDFK